jgi:hypothetical protein
VLESAGANRKRAFSEEYSLKRTVFVFLLAMFIPPLVTAQDGLYRFVKEIPIGGDTGFDYLSVILRPIASSCRTAPRSW